MENLQAEKIAEILADLVLRINAMERILIRNKVVTEHDITNELAALQGQLISLIKQSLPGAANEVKKEDATITT